PESCGVTLSGDIAGPGSGPRAPAHRPTYRSGRAMTRSGLTVVPNATSPQGSSSAELSGASGITRPPGSRTRALLPGVARTERRNSSPGRTQRAPAGEKEVVSTHTNAFSGGRYRGGRYATKDARTVSVAVAATRSNRATVSAG